MRRGRSGLPITAAERSRASTRERNDASGSESDSAHGGSPTHADGSGSAPWRQPGHEDRPAPEPRQRPHHCRPRSGRIRRVTRPIDVVSRRLLGRANLHARRQSRPENFEHVDVSTGRVWVSSESGVLRRMDPTAGRVELSVPACDDTDYVVAAVGSIWRRATAAATSSGSIPTRVRGSPRSRSARAAKASRSTVERRGLRTTIRLACSASIWRPTE